MTYPLMSLLLIFSLNIKNQYCKKVFRCHIFRRSGIFWDKKFPAEGLKRNRQKTPAFSADVRRQLFINVKFHVIRKK